MLAALGVKINEVSWGSMKWLCLSSWKTQAATFKRVDTLMRAYYTLFQKINNF